MHDKTFEADAECSSCGATGLYVGIAERGGDAVVCYRCKGTGCERISIRYTPFTARKQREKPVLRVLQVNPGIVSHPDVVPGGVPYDEWVRDPSSAARPGAEMRQHTCPAWWYQTADSAKKPDMDEYECELGVFSRCSRFPRKRECWAKWDREHDHLCARCGGDATYTCTEEWQLVCGTPLCDECVCPLCDSQRAHRGRP